MPDKKDPRFFPVFLAATAGVLLEVIAALVDEIVVGTLFDDAAFSAINLVEPFTLFEVFMAYLITVAGAALIVRSHGASDRERMNRLYSQTLIGCGICGAALTLVYVLFTPQLVRLAADDPLVYDDAYAYFTAMRFYPLVDMFDTFIFTYVLYRGGYKSYSKR